MSRIQWTDETWNPVTGCTKVSEGCRNCYAERLAPRVFAGQTVETDKGKMFPRRFTDVRTHADRLDKPMRWRKPRRVFVNSMSDLFHEDVPEEFLAEVFNVMASGTRTCNHRNGSSLCTEECVGENAHTFQILTKRPERMREMLSEGLSRVCSTWNGTTDALPLMMEVGQWPLPNVWLGVSVEDQETADERIPILLDTPAAVRFVSAEPLLEAVNLRANLSALDWVIVGGESGPKARPCDIAWIRSIVKQCRAAGVAPHVKQMGANFGCRTDQDCTDPGPGEWMPIDLHDPKGGNMGEWPEDVRVREVPR